MRRRRIIAALLALAVLVLGVLLFVTLVKAVFGGDDGDSADAPAAQAAKAKPKPIPPLPGGGTRIFPERRVVAFYGNPDHHELGILGIGTPDQAGQKLLKQAKAYEVGGRKILPAMELISQVATAAPGEDGYYRRRTPHGRIARYLKAARKVGAILVLDIQPGRADFLREARYLKRWLKEPDVGLALDPEWRITDGQLPGKVIGSVDAMEVNAVSFWLDEIVRTERLPQKLFIVHQFTIDMIKNRDRLKRRKGLAMVLNADGFGGREIKVQKYKVFSKLSKGFQDGFKLFYKEDVGLMKPRQVLRLRPDPDVVIYE